MGKWKVSRKSSSHTQYAGYAPFSHVDCPMRLVQERTETGRLKSRSIGVVPMRFHMQDLPWYIASKIGS